MHVLLSSKKHFENVKKNLNKKQHVYLNILCGHTKFREKPTIFVACVKKNVTLKDFQHAIFSFFLFLHTTYVERVFGYKEYRDVHVNFSNIWQFVAVLKHILKQEHKLPATKTPLPRPFPSRIILSSMSTYVVLQCLSEIRPG